MKYDCRLLKGRDMKKTLMVFIVLGLLCSYDISFGDIFRFTDDDGVIHLTNVFGSESCKKYGCKLVHLERMVYPESVLGKSSTDWVKYGEDNDGNVFLYNKRTITKGGKKYIKVWDIVIISDEGRDRVIKDQEKNGLSTDGWGLLTHNISLCQIDCNNKMIQILSVTEYDINGKVLSSVDNNNPKWKYIVLDSMGDSLRKKVCK